MTTLAEADLCKCGKPATGTCWDLQCHPQLQPCYERLCLAACPVHRHQPGSMGYAVLTASGKFNGFQPDRPGFVEWLRCRWRDLFWTARQKAQYAWDEVRLASPPPAPLPGFFYQVGSRSFSRDQHGNLYEVL